MAVDPCCGARYGALACLRDHRGRRQDLAGTLCRRASPSGSCVSPSACRPPRSGKPGAPRPGSAGDRSSPPPSTRDGRAAGPYDTPSAADRTKGCARASIRQWRKSLNLMDPCPVPLPGYTVTRPAAQCGRRDALHGGTGSALRVQHTSISKTDAPSRPLGHHQKLGTGEGSSPGLRRDHPDGTNSPQHAQRAPSTTGTAGTFSRHHMRITRLEGERALAPVFWCAFGRDVEPVIRAPARRRRQDAGPGAEYGRSPASHLGHGSASH